ncbi:hypothetical protein Back11_08820 [Paenibacillus baekrokdamisoli]|uniref:Uncharacterized protein n=1 Tax=Paenibacillus baekrokdamisoli TaxID=1712516 RepID=A0A3G9IKT3_9BACL|nr:HEAT repeat domain-containing protein [Paenibacillus baekrokdamisoli]MBB3067274.1 hypothetical protein [Paenibacillus baekrokdamisoli]BBH19537.1 hypothetical protein Back11_08820 [Paenibacillus baekrokdamisoli]
MAITNPLLLTDQQMKSFITNGFLILKTDFSKEFHAGLVEQLNEIYDKEGNPGNNLLPRIRDVQRVFENPVIVGALTSVLGPDYLLHTHRHGHYNLSPQPGGWHKDSYWGYDRLRNHHPWWAMIMYFPQDTPLELGPTGVMPGTQYSESRTFAADEMAEEATASGEAGTFALIHYDIWHRSTANVLGRPRFMLKFEFMRTAAPAGPTWDNKEQSWSEVELDSPSSVKSGIVEEEIWNWLSGNVGSLAGSKAEDEAAISKLVTQLEGDNEPSALAAAYELAARGSGGKDVLLKALHHDKVSVSRLAAYGLSVAGASVIPDLIAALDDSREETVNHAAFALGELRDLAQAAVPKLNALLDQPSAKVRRTVMDVLGMIGVPTDAVVAGLIKGLQDEDEQVRFTAGLSLTRIGTEAEAAVPYLEESLADENRYVRGHALEALRYIGTKEANEVLMKELFNTRWCSTTTPASTF